MLKKLLFTINTSFLFAISLLAQEAGQLEFQEALSFDKQESYEQAFQAMKKSAELGYLDAMNELAYYYEYGIGTEANNEKSIFWFEKGAQLGDLGAIYNLGSIHIKTENYEKAYQCYKRLAEEGNARGMILVANMYKEGKGIDKNISKSLSWYEKAANTGNTFAMTCIADIYKNGDGIKKNYEVAKMWYEKAAGLGDKNAKAKIADNEFWK